MKLWIGREHIMGLPQVQAVTIDQNAGNLIKTQNYIKL